MTIISTLPLLPTQQYQCFKVQYDLFLSNSNFFPLICFYQNFFLVVPILVFITPVLLSWISLYFSNNVRFTCFQPHFIFLFCLSFCLFTECFFFFFSNDVGFHHMFLLIRGLGGKFLHPDTKSLLQLTLKSCRLTISNK